MIHIYDANAWLRRALNRVQLGTVNMDPRVIYYDTLYSADPQLWVWDGPNNNDRRRALFPPYKIRDYDGQENIFAGLQIYRDVLKHSRAVQITVPGWEADDVCATLARRYTDAGEDVTIYTNDFDYWQLSRIPRLTLRGFKPTEGVEACYIPLYKSLVGDKSDKIPGLPNFGHKGYTALTAIHHVLDKALRERDAETLRNQPWKPQHKAWLADDANVELLFVYHQITQMLDVPMAEIEAHMKVGVPNPEAAEELFKRFMF